MFNSGGTVHLDASTLSDNSASTGAAILIELLGTATVNGSSFFDNIAGTDSGSIDNRTSGLATLTVRDSTFSRNNPKAIRGGFINQGGNTGI